ncbi:Deoxyguanosinetriphosphate triphosphohydrolase [Acidisarcina polymorpha]|uniref:Deoxyguanosinetriphosphate triphosphohydrolase-like protein n=1 Tax=Acidisarcina polymorpha TaxID=2211140 RepID=A0A2Z5FY87_9BACT|nr:dNTP triphosphohydrolase [Acidisarcina polymorpha]AXC11772.1 Deoxyguanosinetriphosphate triphosphohydrolase [Acidisarcina polymorpha]
MDLSACAVDGGGSQDPLTARAYPENAHAYRTAFERDRGRVTHARSFRRMAGKTQVFSNRYSDHFRSRLTHTLEVSQIARTVAGALGLNQELTETLALVHDIGHPPFGHAGERALDAAMREHGLIFDHNLHALRIVEHFEQRYAAHPGLNLTLGVREGIVKHSRDYKAADHPELAAYFLDQRPPLEAQLIDLADEIAYLTADIDDGLEAGILELQDVRKHVAIFDRAHTRMEQQHPRAASKLLLAGALTRMLNELTGDLIRETARRVKNAGATSLESIRRHPERFASLSPEREAERRQAKEYLHACLYVSEEILRNHKQAEEVVGGLFRDWVRNPELLPNAYFSMVARDGSPRVVADYIAGMTDSFILEHWRER